MKLFLDTEFCRTKRGHELLSIGIVGHQRHFYAELDAEGISQVFRGTRPDQFMRETVLDQFGRMDGCQFSSEDVAREVAAWLRRLRCQSLEMHYDYSVDFDLLERLLLQVDADLVSDVEPVHLGYLLDDPAAVAAANAAWADTVTAYGVGRHHALSDAMAPRARYEAVHGPA